MTVAVLAVWLAACGGAASTAATSPTAAPTSAPFASAVHTSPPSPKLELPLVVLDVRAGSDVAHPGTIPPATGGAETRGPETFAVDESGLVWLLDPAKSRVIAYDKGKFARAVAVTDLARGASGLLVASGKLYLREIDDRAAALTEIELDAATGKLLRRADVKTGTASLYPYERVSLGWMPTSQKGVDDMLGHDALGNRYERHYFAQWSAGQCFSVIRRITPAGQDVAEACFDVGSYARDYFVAPDGAVYQLEQLYTGALLDRFAVTRIISPAK